MRILCAPDKFRGSITARDAAAALAEGVRRAGAVAVTHPLSDGGEGFLSAFGGPNRRSLVTGPLGEPVEAQYRVVGSKAWIESAEAIGLQLFGGPEGNDAMSASSYGLGELVLAAVEAGARSIVIGLGGTATTDGGWGALRAMHPFNRLRGVNLVVACDVDCAFVDAASDFAPQKGASDAQTQLLERRLERLVQVYSDDHGVDVSTIVGAGAAGGLAGGLAAIGARLDVGFDVVADGTGFFESIEGCDAIITGEGLIDSHSFRGKVVGGVVDAAAEAKVPCLAIGGGIEIDADDLSDRTTANKAGGLTLTSLSERFGRTRSMNETADLLAECAAEWVRDLA